MSVSCLLSLTRRIVLWSVSVASALTLAFAAADGFVNVSLMWLATAIGVFALAVVPAVVGLAAVGAWRARRRAPVARNQAIDGWLWAGLLVWLFFVRLEAAHQLVGPTRHLAPSGAINLILLALAGLTVVRSWERAHVAGRACAVTTTAAAAALLMAAAIYQDPPGDRSHQAAQFVASSELRSVPDRAPSRVLFLGVDGLDWGVLQAVSAVESLPVLRGLIDGGRRWSLDPAGLKRSPEIWASIHTGQPPGAHGVWGFSDWELWNGGGTLSARPYFGPHIPLFIDHLLARLPAGITAPRLATAESLRAPTFWEAAAADGVRTVAVSPFPFTAPLMALNGVMAVHNAPEGLWYVSRTTLGVTTETSLPESEVAAEPSDDDDDGDLRVLHDQRVGLATMLFQTETPTLGVFYTSYLDEILHRHWRNGCAVLGTCTFRIEEDRLAVVRGAFRQMDEDLGRLIRAFGPDTTVVLLSDHGWELGAGEHVFGPDGVLVVSPATAPGFGGRADIYEVAPSILELLGLPAEAAMLGRNVFDREVARRNQRVIKTNLLRRAARPSADRLSLLRSVGYIAK